MKCVVVKLGGHALDSLAPWSAVLIDLARDVAELRDGGVNVVIVHGGGPQIAELLSRVGLESSFRDGLRVTDAESMPYVAMALSDVNVRIVAALNDAGLASVGLCGADASLLRSEPIGEWPERVGLRAYRQDRGRARRTLVGGTDTRRESRCLGQEFRTAQLQRRRGRGCVGGRTRCRRPGPTERHRPTPRRH